MPRRMRVEAITAPIAWLTLSALAFAAPAWANPESPAYFGPRECEFAIQFPGMPEVMPPEYARGQQVEMALWSDDEGRFSMACKTGYPPGYLDGLSDAEIRRFLSSIAEQMGIPDGRILVKKVPGGRLAAHAATVEYGGESWSVRTVVRYGDHTRAIAETVVRVVANKAETEEAFFDSFVPKPAD